MQISSTDDDYYSTLYSMFDTTSTTSTSSSSSDFTSSFTSTSSTDDVFAVDYQEAVEELSTEELLEEAEAKSQETLIQMMMGSLDAESTEESSLVSTLYESETYTSDMYDELLDMQAEATEESSSSSQSQRAYDAYSMQFEGSEASNFSFMQGGMGGGPGGGPGGGQGGGGPRGGGGGGEMENYTPINSYA